MNVSVDVQIADDVTTAPDSAQFRLWVGAAVGARAARASVSIRVTGSDEMHALNLKFRDADRTTNVLSFPARAPAQMRSPLLGDVVLCAPVIEREAREQGKATLAHWAHMVVHGTLHLLGYDHEAAADAAQMERLEIDVLRELQIEDPYRAA